MNFISEENRKIHEKYLRELKLKMSIFEASYPQISGKGCREILRADFRRVERERAALLRAEIMAHEIFFTSFQLSSGRSIKVCKGWGSEANFLYRIMCDAKEYRDGFIFVYLDGLNNVKYNITNDILRQFMIFNPILAVDICEHSYFLDYLFDRDEYIKNALSGLNLSKIEKHIEKRKK